uniref:Adipokinetic hormone 1 n=1 Tax=Glossina pallidipes TaxID=7398 RepID=A0A1B0AKA0_GLOPL
MNTRRVFVQFVFFALILICVECQLTFSPGWGKRSIASTSGSSRDYFDAQTGNCKTSSEMLVQIFRFMENKAQLYLNCNNKE